MELPPTLAECHEYIRTLVLTIEQLQQDILLLKERLNQNSQNSSRPPSQDYKKNKFPDRPRSALLRG